MSIAERHFKWAACFRPPVIPAKFEAVLVGSSPVSCPVTHRFPSGLIGSSLCLPKLYFEGSYLSPMLEWLYDSYGA